MSTLGYSWPFIPTDTDGLWDFDRATDFDLQPLYVVAQGVARRAEIAAMPQRTAAERGAYDEASVAATKAEDLTAFLLDRAPRMHQLLIFLTSPQMTINDMGMIIVSATRLLAEIKADMDAYG